MVSIKNNSDLEYKKYALKDGIDSLLESKSDDPVQQEVLLLMKDMLDKIKLKNSIQSYYDSLEDDYE